MWLLLLSFLAGVLTVLAPCVLPLLPVILWWSVIDWKESKPRRIVAGFAVSALLFTLLVKVLFDSFGITRGTLVAISAWILIVFGIFFLFPSLWQKIMHLTGFEKAAHSAQNSSTEWKSAWLSDVLLWASLWPVLNSCSPTFALIVYTVLPASFLWWFVNIVAYTLWLSAMLLAIAYWWRAVVNKMRRAANPNWLFRKIVALLIIATWVAILMWWDKLLASRLVQYDYTKSITNWEITQTQELE